MTHARAHDTAPYHESLPSVKEPPGYDEDSDEDSLADDEEPLADD